MPSPPLRVLVLTAYGPSMAADGGGELGRWLEGYGDFAYQQEVPGMPTPVRITDHGVGVTATGIGPTRAAATVAAALSTDLLDTNETYLLTAGTAGISPHAGTVGSVVIADHIVNWDAKKRNGDGTAVEPWGFGPPQTYKLNSHLVTAAHDIATTVNLSDSTPARDHRVRYENPPATESPQIEIGTSVAGADFWHGHTLAGTIESMVSTHGAGTYATTECEGFGTAVVCDRFDALDRYLSIRAASNFDRPPSDANEIDDKWRAKGPAFDNAYRVGRAIADQIAENWAIWNEESSQ